MTDSQDFVFPFQYLTVNCCSSLGMQLSTSPSSQWPHGKLLSYSVSVLVEALCSENSVWLKKKLIGKKTYLLMREIEWFGDLCKTRLWNPSTLLFLSPIKQRFKWTSEILHLEDAPFCSWNLDIFVLQFIFQLLNKRGMALESHSCASLLKNRLSVKCARQRCQCCLGCPERFTCQSIFLTQRGQWGS